MSDETTGTQVIAPAPLRPGELIFAGLMVAAALYAFREAYAISGFTGLTTGGTMPMIAAGVMVVSGLVILRDAVARRSVARADEGIVAYLFPLRLLLFVGLIILFALAIPWIGFTPAACAFVFIGIAMLWTRGIIPAAAVTALAMVAIYAVFRLVFKVVLPTGSLWQ